MTIDIVLPFWGDPQQLFAAVESVRAQTDDRWTLTVLDDAYPDDDVRRYFAALDDERIRYRRHEVNVGIAANFQSAVDAAVHDHLVVMGGDDLLLPGYVSAAHERIARNPDIAIIQPGVVVIGADGSPAKSLADRVKRMITPRTAGHDLLLRGDWLAASLLRGDWLYWPSLIFRRDAIQAHRFREDLPIILDLAIILEVVFAGGELLVMPEQVFAYRRHSASASQTSLLNGRRFNDERRFYRETAERAATLGWRKAARAARCRTISRMHAMAELPSVWRHGSSEGRRALLWHVLR